MLLNTHKLLREQLLDIDGLNYVGWWANQIQNIDEPVYHVPSVWLEYPAIQPGTYPEGIQYAELDIVVRVMTEYVNEEQEEHLELHQELVDAVHRKLHQRTLMLSQLSSYSQLAGTSNDVAAINGLHRIGYQPDHEPTNTMITVMTYRCNIVDISAVVELLAITPTVTVTRPT